MSVPCCHHHLQAQLGSQPALMKPLYRHGILKERLGDLLTETLRAQLLRLSGYRAEVIQFVSPEHTAKNLMIRAVRSGQTGESTLRREYDALKRFFGVTPHLEGLLPREVWAEQGG